MIETMNVQGKEYLLGSVNVARFLNVSKRQADRWFERRDRNGYPEGISVQIGRRNRRLFDPDEMLAWKRSYVPSLGGAGLHGSDCRCPTHSRPTQLTLW